MTEFRLTCFAVGGDSLIGGMDLAPGIAAFFLAVAALPAGLIVWLIVRLAARRREHRRAIAIGAGLGTVAALLLLAAGCWYDVEPLAGFARHVLD
jgi:hypothetical protein